jgi:hypothetical protein
VITYYDFIIYLSLVLRWLREAEGGVEVNNVKVSVQYRRDLLAESM